MPAIGSAGEVAGRRILDAGCGSGALFDALRQGRPRHQLRLRPAMVDIARQRLGDDADLLVADLGRPLPFADDTFDDVVVSLVLHYVKDWTASLCFLFFVLEAV